ncbi:hypothetical protein HMPREF9211_0027 [Lactobacillus iners LactinV 01V1-a]|uniref:Uncharacterized protein n=1 Tax=Lactobacillus iners LactinV 01V1-a TaxID=879297 RepID=E1NT87_9LACO|nr:hypothetical protein HMPREF9211_0027 [Lactobacillus iners LactinV 01V1-a]
MAKKEYSANSAYWVFKLAGTLVDRNWTKYSTYLINTQKEVRYTLKKIRYQYDQKLVNETQQNKVIDIVNQANKEMAQVAIKAFKKIDFATNYLTNS